MTDFTDEDIAWAVPRSNVVKINPYRGASRADIEFAIAHIRNLMRTTGVLINHTMATLEENLPVTRPLNYQSQITILHDATDYLIGVMRDVEGDLIGKLEKAAEDVS